MKKEDKSPARQAADERYEASRTPVLVRFTAKEIAAIDAARDGLSRPQFVKARALRGLKPARSLSPTGKGKR